MAVLIGVQAERPRLGKVFIQGAIALQGRDHRVVEQFRGEIAEACAKRAVFRPGRGQRGPVGADDAQVCIQAEDGHRRPVQHLPDRVSRFECTSDRAAGARQQGHERGKAFQGAGPMAVRGMLSPV